MITTHDIKKHYILNELFGVEEGATASAGVTDHGALTGLAEDDHPQYAEIANAENITGDWSIGTYGSSSGGSMDLRAVTARVSQIPSSEGYNYTGTWEFTSYAGRGGTVPLGYDDGQIGFLINLAGALPGGIIVNQAFEIQENNNNDAGMRLDADGTLWCAKGGSDYDWSGGLKEVACVDYDEFITGAWSFTYGGIGIGSSGLESDAYILFSTDAGNGQLHYDRADTRFEMDDELVVTGNISTTEGHIIVNSTATDSGAGSPYYAILRGVDASAASRRGGAIQWEFDAAGNISGYTFVSTKVAGNDRLVFSNAAQSSATDVGNAWVEFATGAANFGALTATTYGGILEGNLVDKDAIETISGKWTHSGILRVDGGLGYGIDPTSARLNQLSANISTAGAVRLIYATANRAANNNIYGITFNAVDTNTTGTLAGQLFGAEFITYASNTTTPAGSRTLSGYIGGGRFAVGFNQSASYETVILTKPSAGRFEWIDNTTGGSASVTTLNLADAGFSPTAFTGYAAVTNLRGYHADDLTVTGSGGSFAPTTIDAFLIDAQASGNQGTTKGNIRFDGGNWNTGHLQMENGHLWYDSTNDRYRVSKDLDGSAPTSETDGFPVPLSYGHMYTNSDISVALTTTDVWVEVGTTWITGKVNRLTFQNSKELVVLEEGTYLIHYNVTTSRAAGGAQNIQAGIMLDNTVTDSPGHGNAGVQAEGRSMRTLSTTTDYGSQAGTLILDLAANKIVSLALRSRSATPVTTTVGVANMSITRIR